jgi:ATP adenylyltransferase
LEHWFTPWRAAYITSEDCGSGCLLCDLAASRSDREDLILRRSERHYILINRYPYSNGHLMVVPYEHCASLADLPAEARAEMMELAAECERALVQAYQPQGMNVGMNIGKPAGAGVPDHLHLHILPRWSGDTNFMTVVGATRVVPESLDQTYDRLYPLLNPGREKP